MSEINSKFHDDVREVYREHKQVLGIEKTQDECLELFKIVFAEQYKASVSEEDEYQMSPAGLLRLAALFSRWKPDGRLLLLCEYTMSKFSKPMKREEFVEFCKDVTPVAMRIRKLTPAECFRLQDVDDEDIAKIQQSGVSNSKQYCLAGNSITVAPLFYIFKNLFIDTEPKYAPGTQLTIF